MKIESEKEFVIYGNLSDITQLGNAQFSERHTQLEAKFENGVKSRVRKIEPLTPNTSTPMPTTYVYTAKFPVKEEQANNPSGVNNHTEVSVMVNEDFFKLFEKIANRKLSKTRYVFYTHQIKIHLNGEDKLIPIELVKYEVDVFTNPLTHLSVEEQQQYRNWVKVDVEVNKLNDYLTNTLNVSGEYKIIIKKDSFPLTFSQMLLKGQNSQHDLLINYLWDNVFVEKINM